MHRLVANTFPGMYKSFAIGQPLNCSGQINDSKKVASGLPEINREANLHQATKSQRNMYTCVWFPTVFSTLKGVRERRPKRQQITHCFRPPSFVGFVA